MSWLEIKEQAKKFQSNIICVHFIDEERVIVIDIGCCQVQLSIHLNYARWLDVADEKEVDDDVLNIITLDASTDRLNKAFSSLINGFPYRDENRRLRSFDELLSLFMQRCSGLPVHLSIDSFLRDNVIQMCPPSSANFPGELDTSKSDLGSTSQAFDRVALCAFEKADDLRGALRMLDAVWSFEVDQSNGNVKLQLILAEEHVCDLWEAIQGPSTLEMSGFLPNTLPACTSKTTCPSINIYRPIELPFPMPQHSMDDLLLPELNKTMNSLLGFVPIAPSAPAQEWIKFAVSLLREIVAGKVCICGAARSSSSLSWLPGHCLKPELCNLQLQRLSDLWCATSRHVRRDFGAKFRGAKDRAAMVAGDVALWLAAEAAKSPLAHFILGQDLPPGCICEAGWAGVAGRLEGLAGLGTVTRDWGKWVGVDRKGICVLLNLRAALEDLTRFDKSGLAAWALGMQAGGPPRLLPVPAVAQLVELGTELQFARSTGNDAEWRARVHEKCGARFIAWHGSPVECWSGIVEQGLIPCSGKLNLQRHGARLGVGVYLGETLDVSWPYAKPWQGENVAGGSGMKRGGESQTNVRASQRARRGDPWAEEQKEQEEQEEQEVGGRWAQMGEVRIAGLVEVAGRREEYRRRRGVLVVADPKLLQLRAVLVWEGGGRKAVAVSAQKLDEWVRKLFPL